MSSINHASIVQTHTCQRVVGDHPPGIDCLPDEQVIPLLLFFDTDTLLNVGLASDRLYHLVCDKEVWT